MKKLIVLLCLIGVQAFAGTAHLTWSTTSYNVDSPLDETSFKLSYTIDNTTTGETEFGPPMEIPVMVGDTATWQRTMTIDTWKPGTNVCFQIEAYVSGSFIGRSNSACKKMPLDPSAPVSVKIDYP